MVDLGTVRDMERTCMARVRVRVEHFYLGLDLPANKTLAFTLFNTQTTRITALECQALGVQAVCKELYQSSGLTPRLTALHI